MYCRRSLRISALLTLLILSGCADFIPRYLTGPPYEKALAFYERGMLNEAREEAEKVPKNDIDYRASRRLIADIRELSLQIARRHMELGEDYEKAGIYSRAISEYQASLRHNPSNLLLQNRIASILASMREMESAGTRRMAGYTVRKKEQSESEDPEVLANNHYLKGKIYLEARVYQKAIEEFNSALRLLPSYMDTQQFLARAKKELGKEVDYRFKRGINYFQKEELELAIREWDAVLELDPGNMKAAEYRSRAEAIMERLKNIKERQNIKPPM